ncbi:hypothetical protein [Paenibacillus sp. GP183]|uniref:hypothetical protein n=1 Tax=Paenibacillus sp. GP183 TaxID=1882751 RepID=UPI000897404B|nr:hypothetical protein [Paenibacillus sp. GP183]SEB92274.1 hypothetical protein SAMN05443246_2371 [Paenibacillus sp. GP183]
MNAGLIMGACVLIGGAIDYFTGHEEVWGGTWGRSRVIGYGLHPDEQELKEKNGM